MPVDCRNWRPICMPFGTPYTKLQYLAPVGLFPTDKNSFGVMDLNGNVDQWMLNSKITNYAERLFPASTLQKNNNSSHRSVRGGSFISTPNITAHRKYRVPETQRRDIGFRVLRKRKPKPLKEQVPIFDYSITLADIYAKHSDIIYAKRNGSWGESQNAIQCHVKQSFGIVAHASLIGVIASILSAIVMFAKPPEDLRPKGGGKGPVDPDDPWWKRLIAMFGRPK